MQQISEPILFVEVIHVLVTLHQKNNIEVSLEFKIPFLEIIIFTAIPIKTSPNASKFLY